MAWIIFNGKITEVEIIRIPVKYTKTYAKAKDGMFSIPVFEEQIFEYIDDATHALNESEE